MIEFRSMLEILTFTLGPAVTNGYLLGDDANKEAICIDPPWDGEKILEAANRRGWRVTNILLTHAHFDHLGGAAEVGLLAGST